MTWYIVSWTDNTEELYTKLFCLDKTIDLLTHHGMNQPQHTDRILSLRVGEFVVLDYSISVCRIE
jgi:hypothetical protein